MATAVAAAVAVVAVAADYPRYTWGCSSLSPHQWGRRHSYPRKTGLGASSVMVTYCAKGAERGDVLTSL